MQLTERNAVDGVGKCLNNAKRLNNIASLLLDNGHFPMAISLGILALEEIAKIEIVSKALKVPEARQYFSKAFNNHEPKQFVFMNNDRLINGALPESAPATRARRLDITFSEARERGLYVEFTGNSFKSPDESLPPEVAPEIIRRGAQQITEYEQGFARAGGIEAFIVDMQPSDFQ